MDKGLPQSRPLTEEELERQLQRVGKELDALNRHWEIYVPHVPVSDRKHFPETELVLYALVDAYVVEDAKEKLRLDLEALTSASLESLEKISVGLRQRHNLYQHS